MQEIRISNDIEGDKDFFGYKKFSRFLLAMPKILKLDRCISTDGKTWIYYAYPKFTKTSKTKTNSVPIESTDGIKEKDKRDEQVEATGKSSSSFPKLNSENYVIGEESTHFSQDKVTNAATSGGQSDDIQDQTSI